MKQGALSIIVSDLLSGPAGSMGYDAGEMSIPVSLQRIASGWTWLLTVVFFVVPLAIDLSGLWAFLRTYRVWRAGGTWGGWQGAGWFLLMLMLLALTMGFAPIAGYGTG